MDKKTIWAIVYSVTQISDKFNKSFPENELYSYKN